MNSNKRARESSIRIFGKYIKMENEFKSSGELDESLDFVTFLMDLNDAEERKWLDILKCPLCTKVYKHCTLIMGCLHQFCTGCIEKKLREDGARCCPVCLRDLGDNPEQYLRQDKTAGMLATYLVEIFRMKKGLPPYSYDDKFESVASSGVDPDLQDTATSQYHVSVTEK